MLILTDADAFRVNLNKLCKRVLQTACYRNSAAQGNVVIGEFVGCQLACGIDRSARFVHNDIAKVGSVNQLGNKLFAFAGSGSVADGNNLNLVLFD